MVLRAQCGIQIRKKGVLSHKTVEIGSSLLILSFRNVFKEFLFDLLQECSDLKEIHLKYNTSLCSQACVERSFNFAKSVYGLQRRRLAKTKFV